LRRPGAKNFDENSADPIPAIARLTRVKIFDCGKHGDEEKGENLFSCDNSEHSVKKMEKFICQLPKAEW
jgi:hypothetical protein